MVPGYIMLLSFRMGNLEERRFILMTSYDLIWRLIELLLKDKELKSEAKKDKNED